MDSLNDKNGYRELYELQDRVLESIFAAESEFYLTGGTCLSRFYQAKRYSDDLDFFTNDSSRFAYALRTIRLALGRTHDLSVEVETKNFVRLRVDSRLQVDFVNDGPFRYKEPVLTENNYRIDTIENILANKLTAVIGRDNPKDVFDIVLIYTYYRFSWSEILKAAHQKAGFTNEDLVIRLRSFPRSMLEQIKCIDCGFLENFDTAVSEIIRAVLAE
jgi:predicted nucleotidyltransferase component of viral defense system